MTIRRFNQVLGSVFLLIGVLGFIPALCPNGMLLGLFMVDTLHNLVHLASGAVLLGVSYNNNFNLQRGVTLAFGVMYGVVTLLGFVNGGNILGLMMTNTADNILHLAITIAALTMAFGQRAYRPSTR